MNQTNHRKKTINQALFCLLFFLFSSHLIGQTRNFTWAASLGGALSDNGSSIVTDPSGNVYTLGTYLETADFDPGPGVFNLTSNNNTDIFIQKLDDQGNFIWAKSLGGDLDDLGHSITIDPAGDLLISGIYFGEVDFDPGPSTHFLTSDMYSSDVFVLKLDPDGNFIWARSIGGSEDEFCLTLTSDEQSNIYGIGNYQTTVDFDPGAGKFELTSSGDEDVFIFKLNADGEFVWAKSIGGAFGDFGVSIDTDPQNNIIASGYYFDKIDLDPGTDSLKFTSTGNYDAFLVKLDQSGDLIWGTSLGGSGDDRGNSVSTDNEGNIWLVGPFHGSVDFDPGTDTFILHSTGSSTRSDAYILKLDSKGNFIWAKSVGGPFNDFAYDVALSNTGKGYVTGLFFSFGDFDPGTDTSIISSNGSADAFILALDPNGRFIDAVAIGGQDFDRGNAITVDRWGNIYTTGSFQATVDFDPGPALNNITSNGLRDVFIQKMDISTIGIPSLLDKSDWILVYPNPNQGTIHIDFKNIREVSVEVVTPGGNVLYKKNRIDGPDHSFELNAPAGIYILEIRSNSENFTKRYKLLKTN